MSRQELRIFAEDVQNAVIAALDREPPLKKRSTAALPLARFPARCGRVLRWNWPRLLRLTADRSSYPDQAAEYGQYLAAAKALVDTLAIYQKSINDQLHAYLENGGRVPGWRIESQGKAAAVG